MKRILLALAFAAFTLPTSAVEDKVVAIVNDQIITMSTVDARTSLMERQMATGDTPVTLTPQQRQLLGKRTLGRMIDEELQRQYAEKHSINISDAELKTAVADLAKNPAFSKVTKGLETYAGDQISAELRWNKIMAQLLRPQIDVSNAEIDQLINDMIKSRHVVEREISQIFIGADDPASEERARTRMEEVQAQLNSGADFATIARTTSEDAASAAEGGNMGWFAAGELNPQLEEALGQLKPGTTSGLIRTPLGFHIVRLDNVRTTKPIDTTPVTQIHLAVISRPLNPSETVPEALKSVRKEITGQYNKPAEVSKALTNPEVTKVWTESKDMGWVDPTNLQSALQQAAQSLKPGSWSDPMLVSGNPGAIYVLATRQTMAADLSAYRDRVRERLTQNRLELAGRRLMRDLRQQAFVDIRW